MAMLGSVAMQTPHWLAALETHDFVEWRAPAPEATIAAVAGHYGSALPEALLQLWLRSDGLGLGSFEGTVLGASAVLALLEKGDSAALELGYLPVLDDEQSNWVALHVTPPVAPRLSYVPHDDGPKLLYRDLASLFSDLPEAFATGQTADEYFAETAQGDYGPDAARTAADQADAELLLQGGERELIQAVALLDPSQTEAWARLLETDHFVRREARARLRRLTHPPLVELLARDEAAFAEFKEFATRAAQNAGLTVERIDGEALLAGGTWYDLDVLFHRRNIPDAAAKLSAWFSDRAAKRKPGPGNYLR
jgi:hypothetical protein